MNILTLFTHPHAISDAYDWFSVDHLMWIFKENDGYSFQSNESEW